MGIFYINGDATSPKRIETENDGRFQDYIIHVVNDKGIIRKGFTKSLYEKYPLLRKNYCKKFFSNELELGSYYKFFLKENLSVCELVCQEGILTTNNPFPFNIALFSSCLKELSSDIDFGSRVHLPMIGSGESGSVEVWSDVEHIIKHCSLAYRDIDFYIYKKFDVPYKLKNDLVEAVPHYRLKDKFCEKCNVFMNKKYGPVVELEDGLGVRYYYSCWNCGKKEVAVYTLENESGVEQIIKDLDESDIESIFGANFD